MATSHGRDEVRRCRGPFEKYFSSSAVSATLRTIGRECTTFLKSLPVGRPVDLQKEGLANVTLRVLVQVVYGEEVLQKYFQRIMEVSDLLQDAVNQFNVGETRLPFYSYVPSKVNKTAQAFNEAWQAFNLFLFEEYEEERLRSNDGLFFIMMEQLKTHALDLGEQEVDERSSFILLIHLLSILQSFSDPLVHHSVSPFIYIPSFPSFLPSFLLSFIHSFARLLVSLIARSIYPPFDRSFDLSLVFSLVRSFI